MGMALSLLSKLVPARKIRRTLFPHFPLIDPGIAISTPGVSFSPGVSPFVPLNSNVVSCFFPLVGFLWDYL